MRFLHASSPREKAVVTIILHKCDDRTLAIARTQRIWAVVPSSLRRSARCNGPRRSEELVMKAKRKKPPWWFAPVLVTGLAAAGGVLTILFTLAH